jgi:hypothetical protein
VHEQDRLAAAAVVEADIAALTYRQPPILTLTGMPDGRDLLRHWILLQVEIR